MQFMIDGMSVEANEVHLNIGDLRVVITHKGIIMDAFDGPLAGKSVGTLGMTFGEWVERLKPKPVNQAIAALQEKYADEDCSLLDDDIIEQFEETASATNNEGIDSQIEQLVQHLGEEAATERLKEVYG